MEPLEEGETYEDMELEEEHEAHLQLQDRECEKHPGHRLFIPASSFKETHLPPALRSNKDWMRFVKLLCARTVKISRSYTSPARLESDRYAKSRGKRNIFNGTGFITGIHQGSGDCECAKCLDDDGPVDAHVDSDWWIVRIHTASHVLYDLKEVENTQVFLYYDSHYETRKSKVKTLQGWMISSVAANDVCVFECIINSSSLAKELERQNREFEKLFNKLKREPLPRSCQRLLIIASHPHGKAKHITLGEWKDTVEKPNKGERSGMKVCHTYDTPTCVGSSGAQICDFFRGDLDTRTPDKMYYGLYVHSITRRNTVGKSSFWLLE